MRVPAILLLLLVLLAPAGGQETTVDPGSPACLRLEDELAPLFESEDAHLDITTELLRRIEDTRTQLGKERSSCHANLMDWEGHLRIHTGDLQESFEVLTDFLGTYREVVPPEHTVRILRQRGFVLDRMGRLAQSVANYTEAAALAGKLPPKAAIAALRDAGMTYHVLGDYVTAERYYREAEDVIRENAPSDSSLSRLQPSIVDNRIYLLLKQSEESLYPDEQRDLARRAARLAENVCRHYKEAEARVSQQALCRLNQAQAERLQENWSAADRFLTLAAPLVQAGAGINPRLTHWLALEQGDLARDRGNWNQARHDYAQALESATHHVDPEDRADVYERIGQLEEETGNLDEAASAYRRAIELREVQRERFRLQEWSISAFANMQEPYRGLARVQLQRGNAGASLSILDRARARHFQDLQHYHELQSEGSDTLRANVDSLVQLIEEERLQILDPGLPLEDRSEHTNRLAELTLELEALQPSSTDTLSLPNLQRHLSETRQTLLAYLISRQGSAVFLARADTFFARPLPNASPRRIDSLMKAVGGPWSSSTNNDPAFSLDALAALYDALIRPIQPILNEGDRLVIVPDSRIAALPFGALVANDTLSYEDADYLVKHHPITMDLAVELVMRTKPAPSESVGLLALGRTNFQNTEDLPNLGFVKQEIRRVSRRVPDSRSWIDEDATETRILKIPEEVNVLHVASHALPDPSLPSQSRIFLWDDPDTSDDGILYLHEFESALSRRDALLDLVVLSGCSTARGKTHAGEGILGLQYAVRTGARSSVATLWSVDDQASVTIMDNFYKYITEGRPKDRALQLAQLDYLNEHDGIHASPFYWGAASLSGEPAALTIHQERSRAFFWIALGIAAIALLTWILPRQRFFTTEHV